MEAAAGTMPTPTALTTGVFAVSTDCNANNEPYEGMLVKFSDLTVTSNPNQHGEFTVSDGSGPIQAGPPRRYAHVTSYDDTEYEGVVLPNPPFVGTGP